MSLRNTIGSADFETTDFAFPQDAVAGLCADAEYFAHLLNSHQPKGETEEIIYAFTYYESPIGRPNSAPPWTPPSTSGGNNSGSIRDDYDNPEDLWEENQDWYEDEDEAWDEWYDG